MADRKQTRDPRPPGRAIDRRGKWENQLRKISKKKIETEKVTSAIAYAIGDRGQGRDGKPGPVPKKRKKYQLEDLQEKTQRDPVALYSDAHQE